MNNPEALSCLSEKELIALLVECSVRRLFGYILKFIRGGINSKVELFFNVSLTTD
jgi:hypothetical protein